MPRHYPRCRCGDSPSEWVGESIRNSFKNKTDSKRYERSTTMQKQKRAAKSAMSTPHIIWHYSKTENLRTLSPQPWICTSFSCAANQRVRACKNEWKKTFWSYLEKNNRRCNPIIYGSEWIEKDVMCGFLFRTHSATRKMVRKVNHFSYKNKNRYTYAKAVHVNSFSSSSIYIKHAYNKKEQWWRPNGLEV